jgi:hypothetical protein
VPASLAQANRPPRKWPFDVFLVLNSEGHQDLGFLPILVAGIVLFGVSPLLTGSDIGIAALNLLAFAVLLGALRAAKVRGRWFRAAAGLGAFGWLLVAMAAVEISDLGGPRFVLTYGFWVVAPIAVLVRVTRDRVVTANTIYGAITAYILFGMLLGFQYTRSRRFRPARSRSRASRRTITQRISSTIALSHKRRLASVT